MQVPPVFDLIPHNVCNSPTWASFLISQSSPTRAIFPVPEEPYPPAAILNPEPSRRTLLRRRLSKMLGSSSRAGGDCRATRAGPIDDTPPNDRERVPSVTRNHDSAKILWGANDSFLPRAKPPPPLKKLNHRRTPSDAGPRSPSRATVPRPSTSHHCFSTSSRGLSKSKSMTFRGPQPKLQVVPVLDVSRDGLVVNVHHTLSRSSTQSSGETDEPRSAWPWHPPSSWAGPAAATSADEDKTPKQAGMFRLLSRKRAPNNPWSGDRDRQSSAETSKTPEPCVVVNLREKGEASESTPPEAVEVQCYKGWEERPLLNVMHKLRELRFKQEQASVDQIVVGCSVEQQVY